MPLRDYSGNSKATTVVGTLSATAVSILLADGTGYPTGAVGPFVVTLDTGLAGEEKVLCASRSGNTLTVATGGRGFDSTTAADHNNGAPVAHTYSATDAREANAHVNATAGAHAATAIAFAPAGGIAATTVQAAIQELEADASAAYLPSSVVTAAGDLIAGTGAGTVARVGVGPANNVLTADAALPARMKWAPGLRSTASATVAAAESTTSATPTDLATVGPSTVVTTDATALVILTARLQNSTATAAAAMGFDISGATVRAVNATQQLIANSSTAGAYYALSAVFVVTGLTPGTQTFKARYSTIFGGTATFTDRTVTVIPL